MALGALTLQGRPAGDAPVPQIAAAILPAMYIGLPLGSLVAIHAAAGREAVLLLLVTIMISDTAQYYGGRALGRRPLAPVISPKKTLEGAVTGVVAAGVALPLLARWWWPAVPRASLAALGVLLALAGIVGDLFESRLKRSADLKDTAGLIPGHGGVLDRIDSLLFAVPVFYGWLRLGS
jgi:phosphatidate cytidylyltransferase